MELLVRKHGNNGQRTFDPGCRRRPKVTDKSAL